MPIRALIYIELYRNYYGDIIRSLRKVPTLDLVNLIVSDNTPVNIEGVVQFNGSILSCIQQSRCNMLLIFSATQEFVATLSRFSSQLLLHVVLLPAEVDVEALRSLAVLPQARLSVCNPLRHLGGAWRARRAVQESGQRLLLAEVNWRSSVVGLAHQADRLQVLLAADALVFVCGGRRLQRRLSEVGCCVRADVDRDRRNELRMTDYTVLVATFKPHAVQDVAPSLTSRSVVLALEPRTALLRVDCTDPTIPARLKIKVKLAKETVVMDEKASGVARNIWESSLFYDGVVSFFRHLESVRVPSQPRLVDLGTSGEEELTVTARDSLMQPDELIDLCALLSSA